MNRKLIRPAHHRALLFVMCLVTLQIGDASGADKTRATRRKTSDQVNRILEREASGELQDRRAALQALPAEAASTELSQWSMGRIQWAKQWVPYDSIVHDVGYQKRLADYRLTRDEAIEKSEFEPLPAMHRRLANWCRTRKLPEQEWFHWTKAVECDPNDASAHEQLGNELINGMWYSRKELAAAKEKSEVTSKQLAVWLPRVRELLLAQTVNDPDKRATVIRRLREFVHPEAVPAIQVAILAADEPLARQLVDLLAEIGTPDAAIALTQCALRETYNGLGDVAIQRLHGLPQEYYVPSLLGALSSPITQAHAILEGGNGQLMLQQVLFRETQSQRHVQQMLKTLQFDSRQVHYEIDAVFSVVLKDQFRIKSREIKRGRPGQPPSADEQFARQAGQNKLQNELRLQQVQIDSANSRTEQLNRRIYHVLSLATEADVQQDAQSWWQWWYARNELYVPQEQKPTQYAYQHQEQVIPVQTYSVGGGVHQWSCLVAGTPIQTAEGLRPIESVQAGDLVLSQHPETGGLAYKPVLYSTVRPPAPIVIIETEKDVIRATGGHLFWAAGKGWVRARTLTPSMAFHDVQGTTQIRSVSAAEEKETAYNLIVADYHTYFVGAERVLSYDNTPLLPTKVTVPGLTSH